MNAKNGNRQRRQFSAQLKLQAIQEARQGGVSISQVCEKYDIRPSQFYQWEKMAEQGALEALRGRKRGRKKFSPREEQLMGEVNRLREVIAEISTENLELKRGRWR
jgi:transposase-like protein